MAKVGASRARWPALLGAVAAALGVGALVYLIDRSSAHGQGLQLFGRCGLWLPSFVHTLAFSLLSAAVLPHAATPPYGACVAWGAVNLAFEMGSTHSSAAPWRGPCMARWRLLPGCASCITTRRSVMRTDSMLAHALALAGVTAVGLLTIVASGGGGGAAPECSFLSNSCNPTIDPPPPPPAVAIEPARVTLQVGQAAATPAPGTA